MRGFSFLLCLTISALLLSGCLAAVPSSPSPGATPPPGTQKFTLSGTVEDQNSNLLLWNGTATLNGQTIAIKDGGFQFDNLAPGTYSFKINRQFYQTLERKVVLTNSPVTLNLKLNPVFTTAELDLLARLVQAEAGGESYEGQVAVAASVLNRLVHLDYPNTMGEVINQVVVVGGKRYYQYEPVLNGTIRIPAMNTAKDAVADALAGWDPSLGAIGFFAPAKVGASSWVRTRPRTIDLGNHRFFK